jgi:hypothetical protein
VRAYNYWISLLDGREFPSVEDLNPDRLEDFGPNSVLFDFSQGPENPAIPFLGKALREEGGMDVDVRFMADVPARSLLSRLTSHCLEIIANRTPIGFEAEYENMRGSTTMYRGILLPFSSDDDTIDFIYGVINWKESAEIAIGPDVVDAVDAALRETPPPAAPVAVWADGPNAAPASFPGVVADMDSVLTEHLLDGDPSLHDRLAVAREAADAVRGAEARSRTALYRVLGQAHDFALAIGDDPESYQDMLEDAGLKLQARAPMTPIVKLIFGVDYDKTRLTEYAVVLLHADRTGIAAGALPDYLAGVPGGLKAIVAAERALKRDEMPASSKKDVAVAKLRQAPAKLVVDFEMGPDEFVMLVGRRDADGRLAILSVAPAEEATLVKVARSLQV